MKNSLQNKLIKSILLFSFLAVTVTLITVPMQILFSGIASFDVKIFSFGNNMYAVLPSVINTFLLVLLTTVLAFPISLFAAMFLWFYEHHIPRLVRVFQALIDSLGAVPSIVYALFGLMLFVDRLGLGFSLLSGVLTMTIIVLPILIRACEQSLQAIPKDVYLSGISLGQSKIYVMLFVLLPQAWRGVCSGILLSAGRIVGESAALIFTLGTASGIITSFRSSGRTLAVQVYALAGEGLYLPYAYATSLVLLAFAALLYALSRIIVGRRNGYE